MTKPASNPSPAEVAVALEIVLVLIRLLHEAADWIEGMRRDRPQVAVVQELRDAAKALAPEE